MADKESISKEGIEKAHDLLDTITNMSLKELEAINSIMSIIIMGGQNAAQSANFYSGMVKSVMQLKHGVCMMCDKVHDDGGEDDKDHSPGHSTGQYL